MLLRKSGKITDFGQKEKYIVIFKAKTGPFLYV
jgi:hypothetical protein